MKTKLENVSWTSISSMLGFCLFLISNSILTAGEWKSRSYFGNMQFHGSILHPVTAPGGGETKKTCSSCQESKPLPTFQRDALWKLEFTRKTFSYFSYSETWKSSDCWGPMTGLRLGLFPPFKNWWPQRCLSNKGKISILKGFCFVMNLQRRFICGWNAGFCEWNRKALLVISATKLYH